jgi:hypothetical protein
MPQGGSALLNKATVDGTVAGRVARAYYRLATIFAAEFSGWVVIYGKHHDVRLFASKA